MLAAAMWLSPAGVTVILLVLTLTSCFAIRSPAPTTPLSDIDYQAELISGDDVTAELSLSVGGATDGVTVFTLADGGDHQGVDKQYAGLVATGAEGQVLPVAVEAGPRWVVSHAGGEQLRLRWRSSRPVKAGEDAAGRYFRVAAGTGLPYPRHLGEGPRRIVFRWRGFAEAGWSTASSFGLDREVTFTEARWLFLHTQFVAAPHMSFTRRQIDDQRALVLAVVGKQWQFSPEVVADDAVPIVRGLRAFFSDPGPPFFLITIVPHGPYSERHVRFLGSSLTNSFAVRLQPPAKYQDFAQALRMILTHEYLHNWYGLSIVQGEREPEVAWFFEGFTTFHTRRLMYRMGLISLDAVRDELNDRLKKYLQSPARNAPNSAIAAQFFRDPTLGDQPYLRGDFIAMLVDYDLRRRTGGRRTLDDLTRELVAAGKRGARETNASLLATLTRETSPARSAGDPGGGDRGSDAGLARGCPGPMLLARYRRRATPVRDPGRRRLPGPAVTRLAPQKAAPA